MMNCRGFWKEAIVTHIPGLPGGTEENQLSHPVRSVYSENELRKEISLQ